jgi:hypothetical protein
MVVDGAGDGGKLAARFSKNAKTVSGFTRTLRIASLSALRTQGPYRDVRTLFPVLLTNSAFDDERPGKGTQVIFRADTFKGAGRFRNP